MWIRLRLLGLGYYQVPAGDDGGDGGGGGIPDPSLNPTPDPENDPSNLISALQKERTRAQQYEKDLQEARKRQQELENNLKKVQSIDPAKYAAMEAQQQKLEEESLAQRNQWDVLKTKAQTEVEAANKRAQEFEAANNLLTIRTYISKAFRSAGGIEDITPIDGVEQIDPIDLLVSHLGPRIKTENGRVVLLDAMGREEKNSEGKPKSLGEKMLELKRGSFPNMFRAENNSSGNGSRTNMTRADGKQLTVYTRSQARAGKADIAAVERGEAIIVDG